MKYQMEGLSKLMMIKLLQLFFLFLLINGCARIARESETDQINVQIIKDTIERPRSVPEHASLFLVEGKSGIDGYIWTAYRSMVENSKSIIAVAFFSADGKNQELNYFTLLGGLSDTSQVRINFNNEYYIDHPMSHSITIQSGNTTQDFYNFDYDRSKNFIRKGCPISASGDYLIRGITSKGMPGGFFCIDISLSEELKYIGEIWSEDERKTYTINYDLVQNSFAKDNEITNPLRIRYYEPDTKKIYLFEDGFFLNPININK